jgi:CubicO group peptidase (beta-lactamase class C family)
MEADASWLLYAPDDAEFGGCCINATLRDYARLGLFVLRDGRLLDGSRALPEHWLRDSLTPSPAYAGYGYYWWLPGDGVFEAEGVFGQVVWVDPARQLVIAMHSAWSEPWSDAHEAHMRVFFEALAAAATQPQGE